MTAIRLTLTSPANDAQVAVELIGEHDAPVARGFLSERMFKGLVEGRYNAVQVDLTADGIPGDAGPLSVTGPLTPELIGETCRWYALCDNTADGHVEHPVLGRVPCCQRCATRHGLTLVAGP